LRYSETRTREIENKNYIKDSNRIDLLLASQARAIAKIEMLS